MMQMNGMEETPVFGLDIGTRSVVGTIGYKKDDKFVVIAQEIREHKTRAMLDGQIHDINRVSATISEVKQALEEKTGMQLQEVCIAAAGRVLKTMNVHVETEYDKERNLTKDDINTLASLGVEQAFATFQTQNDSETHFYCVGYSITKYYVNHIWMAEPEHHKAKNLGADMIATFLPDDVVDGLYSAVELAGLKVANMTLEPIAAIRVAIPERFRLLNIAMIDVGAGTSDISITSDGSVAAFGMIPCAGDALTETLARECLIDFATAEKLKVAASRQEKITYEDIMGLEQEISSEEIIRICKPQIEKMAKLAADEIRSLNGGNSPSAVFVVGGGGCIPGFTNQIATELGLDPKRVALRGMEIMQDVEFPEDARKDSTIVTPIGICFSYYEQNNNFIYVAFNGSKIKLYDNNKLAVIDAAIQAAFSRDLLFPRRGQDLHYTVNGKNRVTKGEYGESAHIFINGEEVDLNHKIKANDNIVMEASTEGEMGKACIKDLVDYHAKLHVIIDEEEIELPKPIKVNGTVQNEDYQILENDVVSLYSYYTYEQLMDYLHLTKNEATLMINGQEASSDAAIYAGDEILILDQVHKESKKAEAAPDHINVEKTETVNVFKDMIEEAAKEEYVDENRKVLVIVNQKPVSLEGKKNYMFVDIFDYINFDTSKMQGSGIVTLVNGKNAQYTQELKNGDKIEVYWK